MEWTQNTSQMTGWLRWLCLGLIVCLLLDLLLRKLNKYLEFRSKINKLPGPQTTNFLLGNIPASVLSLFAGKTQANQHDAAGDFYTSQIQSLLGHTLIYHEQPLFRLWLGQQPVICVWKPEVVEQVLNDSFLLEKSYHYDFLRPWLGDGLLTSPGRIWRSRRKLLVPSFHFNILQAFVPVFDRKSSLLVRNLKRRLAARGPETSAQSNDEVLVDITPLVTACTLDAICETIMGVAIDAQENPNNDYCNSIYLVGETFLERIIQPRYWLDCLFKLTELGKLYSYHLAKLHSFTRKVIRAKKREKLGGGGESCQAGASQMSESLAKSGSGLHVLEQSSVDSYQAQAQPNAPKLPKAFLDLLLDKVNVSTLEHDRNQRLSDEQIREEVDTFMFEGHDTTAMALSWTLFLLGHNRCVQEKLWAEVDQVHEAQDLASERLGLEHLKQLKYLDCVIKEALRLCPSVPFIGRQTRQELKLGEHLVPPGSVIFVLIYQLHRNETVYPNAERFDPDRFLPENTLGRHPFAYVPFSAGPRNCIGQKFAMAEMKTILFHLARNFEFESVTPLDQAKVQMEMVLRPKCALNIRVKLRKPNSQP